MASISETLASPAVTSHLRPFEARRDLEVVANLIELGFSETLDDEGRRYLSQMRSAANRAQALGMFGLPDPGVSMMGFVWEEDGQVVGNLSLIPYLSGVRRNYLIANVVVHPDYRRRGIGRALTARGIEQARQNGAPCVWLHVREENASAIHLYDELGFRERLRRTTWQGVPDTLRQGLPEGVSLGPRCSQDWAQQRAWLSASYPTELHWSLPYRLRYLQPGLYGAVSRFFGDAQVWHWAVYRHGVLCGLASHQVSLGRGHFLWLAAPPSADEAALQALLNHARQHGDSRRPLVLDYPAHQAERAIQGAGFRIQQTLLWMQIRF